MKRHEDIIDIIMNKDIEIYTGRYINTERDRDRDGCVCGEATRRQIFIHIEMRY